MLKVGVMRKEIRGKAPAKINLHLSVIGPREDGYHNLESLFQAVSLYDDIIIRSLKDDDVRLESKLQLSPNEEICCKAARLFKAYTGQDCGVSIKIVKRIPLGAGLGGGSSDAALVLKALNLLWNMGLEDKELFSLGEKIGSDVPFFLGSACAKVTGRGEILEPIEARTDYSILLVYPGFSVSTKEAFKWLAEDHGYREADGNSFISSYKERNPDSWGFYNAFSGVLLKRFPVYREIIPQLYSFGAKYANISGSGSCLFGVFSSPETASAACKLLKKRFWVKTVSALARLPSIVLQ